MDAGGLHGFQQPSRRQAGQGGTGGVPGHSRAGGRAQLWGSSFFLRAQNRFQPHKLDLCSFFPPQLRDDCLFPSLDEQLFTVIFSTVF